MGGEFVVAGGDAPPLLELGEEALDAPAVFVSDLVVAVLVFAMATRRDDGFTALIEDDVVQAIGVVGAIGDHLGGRQALDQITSWRHVVLLTGPDLETDRQAERVYDGVELGAEVAAGATESLGFRSPLLQAVPRPLALARE